MNIKKLLPYIVSLIVMILVAVVYFLPQFQGKTTQSSDIVGNQGMASEISRYQKKTGEDILWTNSMFGGMPTYQIAAKEKNNFSRFYERALNLFMARPAGYFIMGMISFYIAMLVLGVNPWVCLIGSIIFSFTTSNVILFDAGHMTKVRVIMVSAPIVAGAIAALRGRLWTGGMVFTLFMSIALYANHPQMVYYLCLTMLFLGVILLIESIQGDRLMSFLKGLGVLVLGLMLSLGMSYSKIVSTLEYAEDTMRGAPILKAEATTGSSSSTVDGLDWQYAMSWSNSGVDLLSSWIPKGAGGATVELMSKDSKYAKLVGARGEVQGYPYFGGLPSTAGPYYFGAVIFFFFVLGMFIVKDRFKWYFLIGVIFTLLISLGKNFESLNRMLFDYMPLFNKFRTPNSVLSITAILMTMFATYTIHRLVVSDNKGALTRNILIALGIAGGGTLLLALLGPSMIDFSGAIDARIRSTQGGDRIVNALLDDRASIFSSSAYRSFFFILVVGLVSYFFSKEKLSRVLLIAIVGVLGIVDMIQVDLDYFKHSDFMSTRKYQKNFQARAVDNQILKDTDLHYRVHDLTIDPFNSASTSYFHKTIGGYSPAKLQRIQDIIERHLATGNQKVYNMLNTKYFIVDNNGTTMAQQNTAAMGNAWFVDNIKMVNNANEEIDALSTIDPAQTAVVHKEFVEKIGSFSPSKNGSIKLTKYHPERMEYTYSTDSEQMAVFSEIWYGPDKGWKLFVDDAEVPLMRANYLLRAAKLPAGSHTVRMEFYPTTYKTGETISLVCSILFLILAGLYAFRYYKNRGRKEQPELT